MKLSDIGGEWYPLFKAVHEGKTIQENTKSLEDPYWQDMREEECFRYSSQFYRIKPEPKLRPWTVADAVSLIGCLLRYKRVPGGENITPITGMLIGASSDKIFYGLEGHHYLNYQEAFEKIEHSTDHGKTWQNCGVITK